MARLKFSDKEYALMREVVADRTNQQIADNLDVSRETIKTRIKRLWAKTGTRSKISLALWIIRNVRNLHGRGLHKV